MADNFKEEQLELAPPFLRDSAGEVFLRSEGDAKDALIQRTRVGVKMRLPLVNGRVAPPDALARTGDERLLPRSTTETDAAYAARLEAAWVTWQGAGTAWGLLTALEVLGYPGVYLLTAKGRAHTLVSGNVVTTLSSSGAFTFDNPGWNRFLVYMPAAARPAAWVSGGVPTTLSQEANDMRRVIHRWRPAHVACEGIVIQSTGALWGYPTTHVWGSGTWGGTSTFWPPHSGLCWAYPTHSWGDAGLKWGVPANDDDTYY